MTSVEGRDGDPVRKRLATPAAARGAVREYTTRLVVAARGYLGAVLLNLALIQAVLSAPAPRPVARVRVLVTRGAFHPLEMVRRADGTLVGILSRAMTIGDQSAQYRLN